MPAAALMLIVLLARQSFNAVPLARFVEGLSLPRSMQNDLGAILVDTVAPPPSDVVLRVSMFRSWGIDPIEGMAGVTLNTLTFYVVRFAAPVLGLVLFAFIEADRAAPGPQWAALDRSRHPWRACVPRRVGSAGQDRGAHGRSRRGPLPLRGRAGCMVDRSGRVPRPRGGPVRTGIAPSLVALTLMVLAECLLVLVALRVVGVDPEAVPTMLVLSTLLIAYPLTLFPLMGLGILDAVLVAAWTQAAGIEYESRIVAGLIVWRVFSLLTPILLGALAWWRRTSHVDAAPA